MQSREKLVHVPTNVVKFNQPIVKKLYEIVTMTPSTNYEFCNHKHCQEIVRNCNCEVITMTL